MLKFQHIPNFLNFTILMNEFILNHNQVFFNSTGVFLERTNGGMYL